MITAEGLTKRFGDKLAVADLSFSLQPGLVTGFLGPNGAGKSTTMRMILGLDRPTAGRVQINGRAYEDLPDPLRVVGSLLDAKSTHPKRSAANHLRWMAAANGIPRTRVDEVLAMVGLTEVADKAAGGFSLGMAQRLGIAAALLGDPQVLMFDEPVNGLDPDGILWIRNFMKQLAHEGRTVFVSSHLLSEMAQTADHLVIIGRGRLIADVSVEQFLSSQGRATIRLRSPRLAELAPVLEGEGAHLQPLGDGAVIVDGLGAERIGDLAAANGIAIHELAPQARSLEAAYMELTKDSVEYAAPSALPAGPAGLPPGSPSPPPPPPPPATEPNPQGGA